MQLTGCHNGNEMRNATCADTQISIEWPYCSFPILWFEVKLLSQCFSKQGKLDCILYMFIIFRLLTESFEELIAFQVNYGKILTILQ